MEISAVLSTIFRWLHVIAGVVWIGHLYFFNFVNIPFAAKMKEAGASKTVVPELMPRALYWFRWGAAWTWVTGVLLLLLVFYHGGIALEEGHAWGTGGFVSIAIAFLGFVVYDALYKSPLAQNARNASIVAFVLVAVALIVFVYSGHFSYRGYSIHVGAMFGTAMAFNVWFRIWPAQQKIITAVKNGAAPDAALVTLAGMRSRHNTYMSVPLLWMMINAHTAGTWFSSMFGAPWIGVLLMILLGWHLVFQFYQKSTKVPGF
jgi:uncharacterized membrane protein